MDLRMKLKGVSSRNLIERLSAGNSSDKDAARQAQRFGSDSVYVQEVRKVVKELPASGAQQGRVASKDECWLITQWRWIAEHEEAKTDMFALRRVFESCLHEYDVYLERLAKGEPITTQTVVDAAHMEMTAGLAEDRATLDAIQHKTPGCWRRMADAAVEQMEWLRRKAHFARVMAANTSHPRS
jgi:hypothetical protein